MRTFSAGVWERWILLSCWAFSNAAKGMGENEKKKVQPTKYALTSAACIRWIKSSFELTEATCKTDHRPEMCNKIISQVRFPTVSSENDKFYFVESQAKRNKKKNWTVDWGGGGCVGDGREHSRHATLLFNSRYVVRIKLYILSGGQHVVYARSANSSAIETNIFHNVPRTISSSSSTPAALRAPSTFLHYFPQAIFIPCIAILTLHYTIAPNGMERLAWLTAPEQCERIFENIVDEKENSVRRRCRFWVQQRQWGKTNILFRACVTDILFFAFQ